MDGYFFDSSALAKFYHAEAGTLMVGATILNSANRILLSRLTVVEINSVFALKVRTGEITQVQAEVLGRQFENDIIALGFEVISLRETDFSTATNLLQQHATGLRLRTLDALQLAVAIKVKQRAKLDYFVAADKVLCQVAEREGLAVINPEQP